MKNKLGGFLKGLSQTINKHSPELMIFSGVLGLVAAGVMAVSKTPEAVEKLQDSMAYTDKRTGQRKVPSAARALEETKFKEKVAVTWRCYVPSALLAGASVAMIAAGTSTSINSNYYYSKAACKNVTLVAGEGEGSDRRTLSVGTASGLERRELFTDARDISSTTQDGTLTTAEYNALLTARGNEKLAENTPAVAFEGEVETTKLFQYGRDFYMGDIVQITNEYGIEGAARIVEIVMSDDETGFTIYPTFEMIA